MKTQRYVETFIWLFSCGQERDHSCSQKMHTGKLAHARNSRYCYVLGSNQD